jgi:hypothetical protein
MTLEGNFTTQSLHGAEDKQKFNLYAKTKKRCLRGGINETGEGENFQEKLTPPLFIVFFILETFACPNIPYIIKKVGERESFFVTS